MTTVAMKNGIILKAPKSEESLVEILEVCPDDTDYITELKKSLAIGKKIRCGYVLANPNGSITI